MEGCGLAVMRGRMGCFHSSARPGWRTGIDDHMEALSKQRRTTVEAIGAWLSPALPPPNCFDRQENELRDVLYIHHPVHTCGKRSTVVWRMA